MPRTHPAPAKTGAASRRIGPEDEDRQSQLDDHKRDKRGADEDILEDGERRMREGAADDKDFVGLTRR